MSSVHSPKLNSRETKLSSKTGKFRISDTDIKTNKVFCNNLGERQTPQKCFI